VVGFAVVIHEQRHIPGRLAASVIAGEEGISRRVGVGCAAEFHPGGVIHGLAPNVKSEFLDSHYTRDYRSRVDPEQLLADNVLSAHVRSLTGTHLLDVPSSDHHTVKPWFNGKVDFSPGVKDLEGFPLLGGRLEYFEGHPAAALIYGRHNHIINLFTWPSAAITGPSKQTRNGYHLQHWFGDGMTFWAVSDLNETELSQFVSLYRHN